MTISLFREFGGIVMGVQSFNTDLDSVVTGPTITKRYENEKTGNSRTIYICRLDNFPEDFPD